MRELSAFQPSPSTKAYYLLNGNANDVSGQNNTGTPTSITYPRGRFGQGAKFNGSTSKIAIGTTGTLQLTPTVTVSAWFKTSSTSTQIMFSKDSEAIGGYIAYGIYTSFSTARDIAFRVRTATGAVFSDLVASGNYTDDKWHNIVGTYNAGTQALYVDGRRVASGGSGTVIHYATPQIPNIGGSSVSDNWFNGLIDEVIIESRAWTAKEVETYYRKSTLNYKQSSWLTNIVALILSASAGVFTLSGKPVTFGTTMTASKGTFNFSFKNALLTTIGWVNSLTKTASTFINPTKNNSTATNPLKSSSDWTNQDKN